MCYKYTCMHFANLYRTEQYFNNYVVWPQKGVFLWRGRPYVVVHSFGAGCGNSIASSTLCLFEGLPHDTCGVFPRLDNKQCCATFISSLPLYLI